MIRKVIVCLACLSLVGCSGMGAAMQGAKMGLNLSKKTSHIRVTLDGHAATDNKLKKAMTGYSGWKVKDAVGTSPTVRFQIEDPEKFGRITLVTISIHQQFEADYSNQPEFTVLSASNDQASQLKPDTDYNLGAMPAGFKIMNLTMQQVSGVALKPGMKYQMAVTVRADRSETALVQFTTK